MLHRNGIVLVQMHFIQRKQFCETNVTSHAFQQISDFKIFLNASAGHWKCCGGPHATRGPAVGPHCSITPMAWESDRRHCS